MNKIVFLHQNIKDWIGPAQCLQDSPPSIAKHLASITMTPPLKNNDNIDEDDDCGKTRAGAQEQDDGKRRQVKKLGDQIHLDHCN